MKQSEKNKIIKQVNKAESLIRKGESDLSCLAVIIQHLFEEEINVIWSSDGAVVVNSHGEVGFFVHFLNEL